MTVRSFISKDSIPAIPPFLQSFIDADRDAVIIVDPTMRIVAANRSAASSFTRDGSSLANRRLTEVFREPALHKAFLGAIKENAPSDLRVEFGFLTKSKYDVHVAAISLDGATFAVGSFQDITEIERLERARQEFLSNISHELRTPLTSILAFVETLEDGAIDDRENNRRFLNTIRRNSERMHALIADILELSSIETGDISLDIKQVRIFNVVEEIFASLSSKADGRGIALINEIAPEGRVTADLMRLEQMLTNLIDNAIKFNREGGTVTVSLESRGDKDLVFVKDTGEGLPSSHLSRIFERFYRVDRGRTREVGGTGLGLAIVKHLAKLHGGEVSVRSTLGQGTEFVIELPVNANVQPI
ncbi:MAG: ATP-binding protein [Pyrinomonadaceae bacterium]|nr:ATP-binding protein [Pyrinomonadaceae bacterium]